MSEDKTKEPVAQQRFSADDWNAEGVRRFGPHLNNWRFICPACGHEAAIYAWKKVKAPEGAFAFNCIGRYLPENERRSAFGEDGPGPCNYTGDGSIKLNPVEVELSEQLRKNRSDAPRSVAYFAFGAPNEYEAFDTGTEEPPASIALPDALYHFIQARDYAGLEGGHRLTQLQDTVRLYNQQHNTHFDPTHTVRAYHPRNQAEQEQEITE